MHRDGDVGRAALGAAAVSTSLAADMLGGPGFSFLRNNSLSPGGNCGYVARQEMIRVIVYGCLFFLILNNLHRRDSTMIVIMTLIILALCLSLFAIFQFATGYPQIWQFTKPIGYLHRGSGNFYQSESFRGVSGHGAAPGPPAW